MGANNVKQVYAHWKDLGHRPHRLLAYMALRTLDADSPPRYWAGRDSLAEALGYSVPPAPADDDESPEAEAARRERATGHNAVSKVTGELVKAGALIRLHPGNFRTNAVFALVLSPAQATPQGLPTEPAQVTPHGSPRTPLKGSVDNPSEVLEVTRQRSPYEYEEKKGSFKGMQRPAVNGSKLRPKVRTLMNDPSPQSLEKERARQMRALQEQMSNWGKT